MVRCFAVCLTLWLATTTARCETPIQMATWMDSQLANLMETYFWLHQNPEVSFQEEQTAAQIANLWEADGYRVTRGIGGHGIVGLLENGPGPTLMLRTDLDALPVTEQTQLPYASTKKVELPSGGNTGVMHACGHDLHMTNLVAVARYLATHKRTWSGTIMLVGQPAERPQQSPRAIMLPNRR